MLYSSKTNSKLGRIKLLDNLGFINKTQLINEIC